MTTRIILLALTYLPRPNALADPAGPRAVATRPLFNVLSPRLAMRDQPPLTPQTFAVLRRTDTITFAFQVTLLVPKAELVRDVVTFCTHLFFLDLSHARTLSRELVCRICDSLPWLRELKLSNVTTGGGDEPEDKLLWSGGFASKTFHNTIQILNLDNAQAVYDDALRSLGGAKHLRTLVLRHQNKISARGLACLCDCRRLTDLDLNDCAASDDCIAALAPLGGSLLRLDFTTTPDATTTQATEKVITDRGCELLGRHFLALRSLNLKYSQITDTGLRHLTDMGLENLVLGPIKAADKVTLDGLRFLCDHTQYLSELKLFCIAGLSAAAPTIATNFSRDRFDKRGELVVTYNDKSYEWS